MTRQSKAVAFVAVTWCVTGVLLLVANASRLVESLKSPASMPFGGIRVAPDYTVAAVAALGVLIGLAGVAAAVGLWRGQRSARLVLE